MKPRKILHSDGSLSGDDIEIFSSKSATESGNGSAKFGIEGALDFDSYEATDGESDFDFSDAESDCGIVHANAVCTKQIPLLPKSVKYVKIDVNRNGVGRVPEIKFTDEIFFMGCVVEAIDGQALISVVNLSDHEIMINVPMIDLEIWNEIKIDRENLSYVFRTAINRLDKIKQELKTDHMNDEEKKSIFNLIEEFSDVFYLPGDALNDNPEYEYKIEVREGTKPINLKPFRVPFHLKDEMKRNIDELLEKKVIEESTSPWGLNAFLVPKKVGIDGKKNFRLVVDLRKLNELMIKDVYPLPLIDEIL